MKGFLFGRILKRIFGLIEFSFKIINLAQKKRVLDK